MKYDVMRLFPANTEDSWDGEYLNSLFFLDSPSSTSKDHRSCVECPFEWPALQKAPPVEQWLLPTSDAFGALAAATIKETEKAYWAYNLDVAVSNEFLAICKKVQGLR